MISKERIDGSWNQILGAVKENFGQITGDELKRVEGNAEQLIGLVQRKTGKTREQIESFLDDCCRSADSTLNRFTERASEYADMAGEEVRDNYQRMAAETQRGYDYTLKTMKRRPLESVAIALGAGLLAGLTLGLTMSSRRR